MSISYTIDSVEIFDDFVTLSLFDNAATPKTVALDGFQIDINVSVVNQEGKEECFLLVLQSHDRLNGMEAFNGYEMSFANTYGCDADKSDELEVFVDYDRAVLDAVLAKANKMAREYLNDISELDKIIALIKTENARDCYDGNIGDDEDTERLLNILNIFDLEDDEDMLAEKFGVDGMHRIRDAENGMYN